MTLVLVHGGGFAGSCWDRMLPHLQTPAVAVDLPGRGNRPADLSSVTLADFAGAVVDEIESRDLSTVVLVGHSLAGMTLPRVVGMVPDRIAGVAFVSCCVPPHGRSTLEHLGHQDDDNVGKQVQAEARARTEAGAPGDGGGDGDGDGARAPAMLDADVATAIFCNDMDAETTQYTLSIMCSEALGVISEPMDLSGLSASVPRTWVRLTDDVIMTPAQQDGSIAEIGADVVELDSGHMAMISRPRELAAILDRLHGTYVTDA